MPPIIPKLVIATRTALRDVLAGSGAEVPSLREALNTLHFDLAGAPVKEELAALLSVAGPTRLQHGSDFPSTPWQACQYLAQQLETSGQLDDAALDAMFRANAEACLVKPRTP